MPLKLVKIKNSPNWYVRGTVRGDYIFETTGTEDGDAAEQIRIKKEGDLLHASIHGGKVSRTFASAAVAYMEAPGSSEKERRFIIPLAETLGHMKLEEITQEQIDSYIKQHYSGRAPATILRNVITPLTAVLNFAARRKWCDKPSFDRPKQPKGRERWATYEEAGAILSNAAAHLQPLLIFLLYTGARMSEALDLEWKDVDLEKRWAVFRNTKNGEDRGAPLRREIVKELYFLPHREGNVFLTDDGERYQDTGRTGGGQIKTAFWGACVRAGLARWEKVDGLAYRHRRIVWAAPKIVPHDLRHTCSTWLLMVGVEARIRDELLGHAPGSMGSRYAHVPVPYLMEAVDRLPRLKSSVEISVNSRKKMVRYRISK